MTRSFPIGVTGGIGSGKSAVTDRFAALGVPVHDADQVARELVEPGQPALREIVSRFGAGVLGPDGGLDRAALRAMVFDDQRARLDLNAILHPRVHARLVELGSQPGPRYVLVAVPLLVEALERYGWLRRILVIDAPREIQIERTMARDGSDRAVVERILAAQTGRRERLAIADDVIANDGPIEALDPIVTRLHEHFLWAAGGS